MQILDETCGRFHPSVLFMFSEVASRSNLSSGQLFSSDGALPPAGKSKGRFLAAFLPMVQCQWV